MDTYTTVGTPGSDSEYFAGDYSKVHCMHGRFIGYPGGADFICPYCEDGATVLEHRMVARLEYTRSGASEWEQPSRLATCYTPGGMAKWNEFIALVRADGADWIDLYWTFDVESYWVRP